MRSERRAAPLDIPDGREPDGGGGQRDAHDDRYPVRRRRADGTPTRHGNAGRHGSGDRTDRRTAFATEIHGIAGIPIAGHLDAGIPIHWSRASVHGPLPLSPLSFSARQGELMTGSSTSVGGEQAKTRPKVAPEGRHDSVSRTCGPGSGESHATLSRKSHQFQRKIHAPDNRSRRRASSGLCPVG